MRPDPRIDVLPIAPIAWGAGTPISSVIMLDLGRRWPILIINGSFWALLASYRGAERT